jgi:hypothetical protein
VLYQRNIEAVCLTKDEIRQQIRLTVMHEFGHYFGMDEEELKDVIGTQASVTSPCFSDTVDRHDWSSAVTSTMRKRGCNDASCAGRSLAGFNPFTFSDQSRNGNVCQPKVRAITGSSVYIRRSTGNKSPVRSSFCAKLKNEFESRGYEVETVRLTR